MGLGDIARGVYEKGKDAAEKTVGATVDTVDQAADAIVGAGGKAVETVRDVLDIGEPDGIDGGSQAGQQLAGLAQRQSGLQAEIAAGQLWMEPDVAERAAVLCEQQVDKVNRILLKKEVISTWGKFGDNEDGTTAARCYVQSGDAFVTVMMEARGVFERMAETYRAAGHAAAQAEEANQQMFGSGA